MASAPRKIPRAEQKEATRARIKKAALELFVEQGFTATTTRAIADRAEVAAGTIFIHASDKEDLLLLVMHDQLSETLEQAFATLPDVPFLDQLKHIFERLFRMYEKLPQLAHPFVRTFLGAKGPNASPMNELTFRFMTQIGELVIRGQKNGELAAGLYPVQAAHNFFALYYMVLMGWLSGFVSLKEALDPGLRSALALQIRGMLPR